MIYNLSQFGELFLALRKAKNLSYKGLSETSGVAKNTLRNIERGKVIPNIETLTLLSNYLGANLTTLFLSCKKNRHTEYETLKHAFEMMISAHKTDKLADLMSAVENLLSKKSDSSEDKQLIQKLLQLYYRMIGHYETYIKHDDLIAMEAFTKSLRVTLPEFQLHQYDTFTYNYDELHILFNIVQMNDRQEKLHLHITMYEFIYEVHTSLVETEVNLFPLLINNLAVAYLDKGNYKSAIYYCNLGLRFLNEKQITIDMPALLLCKGIILHYIDNDYSTLYINLCFELLTLSNQKNIITLALGDLKEKHNIEFNLAELTYTDTLNPQIN